MISNLGEYLVFLPSHCYFQLSRLRTDLPCFVCAYDSACLIFMLFFCPNDRNSQKFTNGPSLNSENWNFAQKDVQLDLDTLGLIISGRPQKRYQSSKANKVWLILQELRLYLIFLSQFWSLLVLIAKLYPWGLLWRVAASFYLLTFGSSWGFLPHIHSRWWNSSIFSRAL